MNSTPRRFHWRVRTTVPTTYPQHRRYQGFTIEKVRQPRTGIDRGTYLVRSAEGLSRVAIVRGVHSGRRITPHRIFALRDRVQLEHELAAYWPTPAHLPVPMTSRDAVGDFAAAIQFACLAARQAQLLALTSTPETSDV